MLCAESLTAEAQQSYYLAGMVEMVDQNLKQAGCTISYGVCNLERNKHAYFSVEGKRG